MDQLKFQYLKKIVEVIEETLPVYYEELVVDIDLYAENEITIGFADKFTLEYHVFTANSQGVTHTITKLGD